MIHLKTLNKQQLSEFVSSGEFRKYDFLPITEHRAKSHIANPKATDEQTLLILAFDDERLAGYLGCFPDHFKIDGIRLNYAWLSTLYIGDQFRGKRIAQALLSKAFEAYDGNIALTEFTKEAESLYNKVGVFQYIQPKTGKRYYFRTDFQTIIPTKKPDTKSLKPLFGIADGMINSLISLKNSFKNQPDFKFEVIGKIDSESAGFISKFQSNRNADEINSLIENPWVLERETEDEKYMFSSYAKVFRYFWVKIYDENNTLITCSLLLLRDGHLKVSYLFTDSDLSRFIQFLSYFIIKNKVKILTSYQAELNKKIEETKGFPKIHERDLERRYLLHQQLLKNLSENFNPNFQDGDGDCVMT